MANANTLREMLANLLRSNPNSTAGKAQNYAPYQQYMIDAQTNGQEPLPQDQWMQMQQMQQMQQPQSQMQVPQNGG